MTEPPMEDRRRSVSYEAARIRIPFLAGRGNDSRLALDPIGTRPFESESVNKNWVSPVAELPEGQLDGVYDFEPPPVYSSSLNSLPVKLVTSSLGNSGIGLIIGGYYGSKSSQELPLLPNLANYHTNMSQPMVATEGPPYPITPVTGVEPSATPSSAQTITPSQQQDRVRKYSLTSVKLVLLLDFGQPPPRKVHHRNDLGLLATLVGLAGLALEATLKDKRFALYAMSGASLGSQWLINNVVKWLDYHTFNPLWKEAFRRNAISGNRFLELANFEPSSHVWRQFSNYLELDAGHNLIERFIELLNETISSVPPKQTPAKQPSSESREKQEFRKLTPMGIQAFQSLPLMRPLSYIDPNHYRSPGNRSVSKDSPVSASASSPTLSSHPPNNAHKFFRKHDLHQNYLAPATNKNNRLNLIDTTKKDLRKSGLFNLVRGKLSNKEPQSASAPNSASSQQTSHVYTATPVSTKLSGSFPMRDTLLPRPRTSTDLDVLPNQLQSIREQAGEPPEQIPPVTINPPDEIPPIQFGLVDENYFPKRDSLFDDVTVVLVLKDNILFLPIALDNDELSLAKPLKEQIAKVFDWQQTMFSLHLTDFYAIQGPSLPDHVLLQSMSTIPHLKLFVKPEVGLPGAHTFLTTSLDLHLFEMKSDDIKKYPATPQYLLQRSQEATSTDYLNCKDSIDPPPIPLLEPAKAHYSPLRLGTVPPSLATRKSPEQPNLQINTSEILSTSTLTLQLPALGSGSGGNLFRVIRREGREIDFDKRRKSLVESKAPKLIPNIYTSSIQDQMRSPILALTVTTKDDKCQSAIGISPISGTTKSPLGQLITKLPERAPALDMAKHRHIPVSRTSSWLRTVLRSSTMSDMKRQTLALSSTFIAKRSAPPPPDRQSLVQRLRLSAALLTQRLNLHSSKGPEDVLRQFSFKEIPISFDDAPAFEDDSPLFEEEDDFFAKPLKKSTGGDGGGDEDFFHKQMPAKPASRPMNVLRPPPEEVLNNLERYFPTTDLDKPIIEESTPIKPVISKTFSSANLPSPLALEKKQDNDVYYNEEEPLRLVRRMKTIRVVAKEARSRLLAGKREKIATDSLAENSWEQTLPPASSNSLHRLNTKMWGQRVTEMTLVEIELGAVSNPKGRNGSFDQCMWLKGELIGRGLFGCVYLGLNVTTGDMLAVKQVVALVDLRSKKLQNHGGIAALHKEVETMKDLEHVNIVQYLGYEQKGDIYNMFLEYVLGGLVLAILKQMGKFDEDLIRYITRQVLLGLEYLHSNGILHRDMKADNLLLEVDGTCKISDFGISKRSKDIYSNNAEMLMQGTVFWMAPEVIDLIVEDKKQGYSAKVDIWSLGCIVLEMYAGHRPWSNEAVVSAIYKIGKTKLSPPIPLDIDMGSEGRDLIEKCFTIDPEMRPTALELLQHPFIAVDSKFRFEDTKLAKMLCQATVEKNKGLKHW